MVSALPIGRPQLAVLRNAFPVDWSMKRRYRLPDTDPGQAYYIYYPGSLSPDDPWRGITFDDGGVVRAGGRYNPVTAAQYALYCHERALRGVPASAHAFLTQVDWLVSKQRADGAYAYEFAVPEYRAEQGFLSAMAQGVAASALVRAFVFTGDDRYRAAAVNACRPLEVDIDAGGAAFLRENAAFFEEVAIQRPCHILNGHLFAAFGIWDLSRLGLASDRLRSLHEKSIETLQRWLPYFEDRGWTYYQLGARNNARHYVKLSYHHLHIAQMHVYAAMTGIVAFSAAARRWQNALDDAGARMRVWLDSTRWVLEVARQRAGLEERTPWQPMCFSSEML